MHAGPQRPAIRGVAAHGGGASDAESFETAGPGGPVPAAPRDQRTVLWAAQTPRRLPALDGGGLGGGQDPMGAAVRDPEPAGALPPLASWARRRAGPRGGRHSGAGRRQPQKLPGAPRGRRRGREVGWALDSEPGRTGGGLGPLRSYSPRSPPGPARAGSFETISSRRPAPIDPRDSWPYSFKALPARNRQPALVSPSANARPTHELSGVRRRQSVRTR